MNPRGVCKNKYAGSSAMRLRLAEVPRHTVSCEFEEVLVDGASRGLGLLVAWNASPVSFESRDAHGAGTSLLVLLAEVFLTTAAPL
jgi:hypothetical protein